jgi:hypothetical protein
VYIRFLPWNNYWTFDYFGVFEMKAIKKMTNRHIYNRIAWLKRLLDTKPLEGYYIGSSDYAEQAVEQENNINNEIAERIKEQIIELEKELKLRKTNENIKIK